MSCTLRISRAGFGCTSFFKPYAIYPTTCNQMSFFIVFFCFVVVVLFCCMCTEMPLVT